MFSDLLRTKSLDDILAAPEPGSGPVLKRHLSVWALMALGIGAVIGAGLFSTVGTAAAGGADHVGAGPALSISFLLTAIACGFAAWKYSDDSLCTKSASGRTSRIHLIAHTFAFTMFFSAVTNERSSLSCSFHQP